MLYVIYVSPIRWVTEFVFVLGKFIFGVSDCCLMPNEKYFSYIMARTNFIRWDFIDVRIVPDIHPVGFYSASSPKQQSAYRHVAPIGHIILIPWQSVSALSPKCFVLSGEVTNTSRYSLWFDQTGAWTHDLPHSSRAHQPLHHRCG